MCAPSTVGALLAFPIWDDASVWLLLEERGVDALAASQPDRPVMGALWALLAPSSGVFWTVALAAQASLWPIFGLLAAHLWRRLFPDLDRFGAAVACLAAAPILTKVQLVTANVALASLPSVVLAWSAALLGLAAAEGGGRARLGAALLLLAAGVLLQEYALAVWLALVVLLGRHAVGALDPERRRRAARIILVTGAAGLAAYATYLGLGDWSARPDVLPTHSVPASPKRLLRVPFELASALWQAVVGRPAAALAALAPTSPAGAASAVYGVAVAAVLVASCGVGPGRLEPVRRPGARALGLAAALAAGLLPGLLMRRVPWDSGDGMATRYALPVVPVAAALVVLLAIAVVRPRFRVLPVALIGLAAGATAVGDAWDAVRERTWLDRLGRALRPHVTAEGGLTVAVVALPERTLGPRRQWELTARLAHAWPAEQRARFWAYRAGG
ncbi:MAG TPA: hypothetical protein VNO23_12715, partial [Candidatus Binatia bacterium]|nr:hypothetical protein [Candidatus Binatia bacterium]